MAILELGAKRLFFVGALGVLLSCGDDTVNVADGGAGNGHGGSGAGSSIGGHNQGGNAQGGAAGGVLVGGFANGGAGGIAPPMSIAMCQGHIYACGDLLDNDNDGLVDSNDPDCLGPCDNTEDSLYGGIPGQSGPPCKVDCYFDQDSGSGNDDCYWSHECDGHETSPDFYPEPAEGASCKYNGDSTVIPPTGKTCGELNQAQSQLCHDYCGPLTPNGCDCFGCCELPAGTGKFVWLGSEGATGTTVCTLDKVDDPTVCHPCQPVADCLNDCGPCEICIGKPLPDPSCFGGEGGAGTGGAGGGFGQGGAGNSQCPDGVQVCGLPGQAACPDGYFCNTGCCYGVPQ
ncbi:MAG: hypothetical protein U0271_20590 [Polyangiaceae bacterium]